jgi:amidase
MKHSDMTADTRSEVCPDADSGWPHADRRTASGQVTRRAVLGSLSVAAVSAAIPACGPEPEGSGDASGVPGSAGGASGGPAGVLTDPLHNSSATAIAGAIRTGELTSEEVVETYLARIAQVNPSLNAVVQMRADAARAEAREADAARARGDDLGPLHGVPMTIKDSLDTAGVITTGGTPGRAEFVPTEDATVVRRLKDAGAILMGKTNTPELTLSFETVNAIYGTTNNPYDLERTPGGSSGGAAALIAAGGTAFDIGSDYGGSIRLPSHFCGTAGIKPTFGRVPRTGHIYPFGGVQDTFQVIGPMARYVDDLILLLPIIAGPDNIDPGIVPMPLGNPAEVQVAGLRVAFHTDNGLATPTAETADTIRQAAQALEVTGAAVEERRPDGVEQTLDLLPIYFWDDRAAVTRILRAAGTTESPLLESLGPPLSPVELDGIIDRLYAFRSSMLGIFDTADVVICPVNAGPAVRHGESVAIEDLPPFSYTFTYSMTGWPGAVVRGGTSPEGLPIGVQVLAAPGREDQTLAVAKLLESQLGGFQPVEM